MNNTPTLTTSEEANAPWNAPQLKPIGFPCHIVTVMSKTENVPTLDYYYKLDADGNAYYVTNDNVDWKKEYNDAGTTLSDLLSELEYYILEDIAEGNRNRTYLNHLLKACRGWKCEEVEVEEVR